MSGGLPVERGDRALPNSILLVSSIHLGIGLLLWFAWQLGGSVDWVLQYFRWAGAFFLVGTAAVELGLTLFIRSRFGPGEPLSPAWTLLMLAAGARLVGHSAAHLLAFDSGTGALGGFLSATVAAELRKIGLLIGGPMHMLLLAFGFGFVLAAYRKAEMLGRFRFLDWMILAGGVFFSLHLVSDWPLWQGQASKIEILARIQWSSDPLLALLLGEALLLRRSALRLGGGLIADCWSGYAVAAIFTLLGDVGLWLFNYSYLPWPLSSIVWYIWIPAAAAFAFAPACQAAAMLRAVRRSRALVAAN
jgi:hypothetical protein